MTQAERPAVVLVGLDTMQGLQAARIFAAKGIPVYATLNDRRHHTGRTRVCREIIEVPADEDLIEELGRLGRRLGERAVIVPCHDRHVLAVSAAREWLAQWFEIVLPEHEVILRLMDKAALAAFARAHDLPVPATHVLTASDDIEPIAAEIRYPCVLKPSYRTRRWAEVTTSKGFKLESAAELCDHFARFGPLADEILVQEWIDGPPSELYSFNGYFDRHGKLLASFVARKLRQWPPETGQSSCGEEVENGAVRELAISLLGTVPFAGLAYVEIKRDVEADDYFIVEPNVGRPTGRSAIAEAGGVEILLTMYCDALGLPLPEGREQRYVGVKWVHLRRDLQSVIATRSTTGMSVLSWIRSLSGPKMYAVFSWSDPLPFVFDLYEAALSLLPGRSEAARGFKALRASRLSESPRHPESP